MNYRHIYHAGNFADVFKHLLLTLCLRRLLEKDTALCVLDAHGGCGSYDLGSEQAQKTLEYQGGIGRLMAAPPAQPDVKPYLDALAGDWKKQRYPGSPLIAARMLRAQDRLLANELHPEDAQTLKKNLAGFQNARVLESDAYQFLRAHLPPKERRGLVLIDPPFEEKDEFETLCRQMKEWKKRWASGVYMIWHPIKPHLPAGALYEEAAASGLGRVWRCGFKLHTPADGNKLHETGLVLLNAPYLVPERMDAVMEQTAPVLGGSYESGWLAGENQKES